MLTSFVFAAVLAAVAHADHRITLRNNCAFTVGMTISSFPHNGVDYTGPAIPDIPAFSSHDVTVPSGYWTFDSANINGNNDYDISNIQGFSVAQRIIPDSGCDTVTCTDVNCACNQAYRPGDTAGKCGGTGSVDQASRVCASAGYTVV
ncbi:hypothetical protein DFH06DRAFT_1348372 [Mycena polygramma]|nr:hypothetical protein DFH06DRAFT_1348372 [Mycena polygramma]